MLTLNKSNPIIDQSVGRLEIIVSAYKSFENIYILIVGLATFYVWVFWLKIPVDTFKHIISWIFVFFGVLLGISFFLWGFFGKEQLIVHSNTIQLNKTIFGIGKKKILQKTNLSEFTVDFSSAKDMAKGKSVMFTKNLGRIRFTNQGKAYAFGLSLSLQDAEKIKNLINERLNVGI